MDKQLTKAFSLDKVFEFRVNALRLSDPDKPSSIEQWYSMGCFRTKVRLDDANKLTSLLDARAEINVMTKSVMDGSGLCIRTDPQLKLVSYTRHSRIFLGLCEDVKVAIGSLKTRYPIFVVGKADHELVLGQPSLNLIKFTQEYQADGIFGTISNLSGTQSAVLCTLAGGDPSNRTRRNIFPSLN